MAYVYRLIRNSIWVQFIYIHTYSRLDGNSLQDIIAFYLFNRLYFTLQLKAEARNYCF